MLQAKNALRVFLTAILIIPILSPITPSAASGPNCPTTICVLDNGKLRFGSGSAGQTTYTPNQNSINAVGLFNQPFYKSADGNWYKLTFSDYPLDMAIGSGTGGPNWTGNTVVDLSSIGGGMTNQSIDYSNFTVTQTSVDGTTWSKGYGMIIVTGEFVVNSASVRVKHVYQLGQNDSFVKMTSSVKNLSSSNLNNVHVWVGTRDDYVGNSDRPKKRRGNLTESGGFQVLANATDQAQALEITTANEGALFYSTTANTNMSFNQCCSFSSAYNQNPSTSTSNRGADDIPGITTNFYDGSYAAVLPYGNLAPNAETQIIWFYAAGATSELTDVARAVASAGAPAVPTVVRDNEGVVVSWLAPQSSDPITNYSIRYRSVGTGDTWTVINRSPASTVRTETVTALVNSLRYEFQVAAWTTDSSSPPVTTQGEWSNSSIAEILGSPNAPTSASATGGDQSAVVSFTEATTNGTETATVTNYEYFIGSPETWTALSPVDTSTPITIPGLTNGQNYTIQIRAVNYWGAGPAVTIQNVRTLPVFTDSTLNTLLDTTTAYSDAVAATSGVTYSYSGTLPTGLTLNTSTGALTGTPTSEGPFTFTITATNTAGTVSRSFTLAGANVNVSPPPPPPVFVPQPNFLAIPEFSALEGKPYSLQIQAVHTERFELQGLLPPGLSLNTSTGIVSGTPTAAGNFRFVIILRGKQVGIGQTFDFVVTAPAKPEVPPSLDFQEIPQGQFGNPWVTVNSVAIPASITPNKNENGMEVKVAGWYLTISAVQENGIAAKLLGLPGQQSLVFIEKMKAYVGGSGFRPNSKVRVHLFNPTITLGEMVADSKGEFSGLFDLPASINDGYHMIQVNGVSPRNELRSASISFLYEKIKVAAVAPVETPKEEVNTAPSPVPTPSTENKTVTFVVPFAFNEYKIAASQTKLIKKITSKRGAQVKIVGYAQPSRVQPDILISLNRAIEVKKSISKFLPKAQFNVSGSGSKTNPLCAPYKNKCVVIYVKP
jgi:hypothetical protein